jgi:Zn-dependent peptidase ImmA (M78 family)
VPRTHLALVNPALLRWGREQVRMAPLVAARKAAVSSEKLATWEAGAAQPTLRQARALAHAYRLPLAAFYLELPPATKSRVPKDYRRLAGTQQDDITSALAIDIKEAWEKREIALELLTLNASPPPPLALSASIDEDPELVGAQLRDFVGLSVGEQATWRDPRRAFNAWRRQLEDRGLLILQTSDLPLEELRAYSLFSTVLPVIVLNRKDVPAGRCFSLIHELAHLALKLEGLCDLNTAVDRAPEEQHLEVFCNAVAAAFLIPRAALFEHGIVLRHGESPIWSDLELEALARHFSTSREALLRRLLTFGRTEEEFYRVKRREYHDEYAKQKKMRGPVAPPVDTVSLLGRPFVRLVLDSLDTDRITTTDASDYLGLRLKHLPALAAILEGD